MVDQYSPLKREVTRQRLMKRRSFLAGTSGLALTTLLAGCQRATGAELRLAMLANAVPAQLIRAFQQWPEQGGELAVNPQDSLVKLAKRLKKNNVAVDIISFAAEDSNSEKLEAFQVIFLVCCIAPVSFKMYDNLSLGSINHNGYRQALEVQSFSSCKFRDRSANANAQVACRRL